MKATQKETKKIGLGSGRKMPPWGIRKKNFKKSVQGLHFGRLGEHKRRVKEVYGEGWGGCARWLKVGQSTKKKSKFNQRGSTR